MRETSPDSRAARGEKGRAPTLAAPLPLRTPCHVRQRDRLQLHYRRRRRRAAVLVRGQLRRPLHAGQPLRHHRPPRSVGDRRRGDADPDSEPAGRRRRIRPEQHDPRDGARRPPQRSCAADLGGLGRRDRNGRRLGADRRRLHRNRRRCDRDRGQADPGPGRLGRHADHDRGRARRRDQRLLGSPDRQEARRHRDQRARRRHHHRPPARPGLQHARLLPADQRLRQRADPDGGLHAHPDDAGRRHAEPLGRARRAWRRAGRLHRHALVGRGQPRQLHRGHQRHVRTLGVEPPVLRPCLDARRRGDLRPDHPRPFAQRSPPDPARRAKPAELRTGR